MNKKFFTLLAASCAAMAVNAQTIYYGTTDGKVTAQVALNDAASTVIANAGAGDARYPYSPFGSSTTPTVAITKLDNVGKGAEAKYFQLMTEVNATDYLLAMQWNAPLGKYQLVLINPKKTSSSYFIEETLWQVTASEVGASKDLRYVFVNKGAQLPLQAATSDPQLDYTTVEGAVITWSWSDVADTKTATSLEGKLIAALDKQYSVVLNYDETDDDGSIIAVKVDRAKVGTAGTDKDAWDAALEFSAYEANPISLNADQINAMMTGTGIKAPVQFNMDPTVTPSSVVNPLTAGKFKAFDTTIAKDDDQKDANGKKIGDFITMSTADITAGYVVLAKGNNLKNMLRVDTLYHNTDPDAIYELKLTTDEFTAPREAYVLGKKLNDAGAALYKSSDYLATAVTIMAKEQAKFRFRYYPSDNSVLVQAKAYLYLDKAAEQSWWKTALFVGSTKTLFTASNVGGSADLAAAITSFVTVGANTTISTDTYYPDPTVANKTALTATAIATYNATDATSDENTAQATFLVSTTKTADWYYSGIEDNSSAEWLSNMIKLTTLTSSSTYNHSEVSVGYDANDAALGVKGYKGINTKITIGQDAALNEAAYIDGGVYYIQNANTVSTDLLKSGDWRYQDLAGTPNTWIDFDPVTATWVKVTNSGESNVVYSPVQLKKVPAAQWVVKGEAGFYTITNRESGLVDKNNTYLWKVKDANGNVVADTYACLGKFANGELLNDTIKLVAVDPEFKLTDGYLNISNEDAQEEFNVFNFKFTTIAGKEMFIGENSKVLKALAEENALNFKVEKARLIDYDEYDNYKQIVYPEDFLTYGTDSLKRSQYRIYLDEVSSNTTEGTGVRERTYVVLDGGTYQLATFKVYVDEFGNAYLDNSNIEYWKANFEAFYGLAQTRNVADFYIKNISDTANDFVLVDLNQDARAFVNQSTGVLEPAGLKSQGASNVYDNSVLSFVQTQLYNYRDIRSEGNTGRDSVVFYKQSNPNICLYETSAAGANIGLLGRINDAEGAGKNYSIFVDTANVADVAKPMFLLGLRYTDYDEHGSNIDEHNKFHYTVADYLAVLTDSAKVNKKAYTDYDGYVRLGFVNAKHEGQTVTITNDKNTIDLSKGLTPVSFAFRYVDTNRDAFYIETADPDGDTCWVKTLNEVPVVVYSISQAETFNVKAAESAPTANDNVTVSNVTVETTTGAVVVKNAAGKKVTVSSLLGQVLAETVASSDNVTIPVASNIVIVAVEGLEAVKAIVK